MSLQQLMFNYPISAEARSVLIKPRQTDYNVRSISGKTRNYQRSGVEIITTKARSLISHNMEHKSKQQTTLALTIHSFNTTPSRFSKYPIAKAHCTPSQARVEQYHQPTLPSALHHRSPFLIPKSHC